MSKWKKRLALPLLCYGLGVLVYLFSCGVRLGLDVAHQRGGSMPELELAIEDFVLESMLLEDGQLVSTDNDPHMIYTPAQPLYIGRLTFSAEYNRPIGEMVLYYTTKPGQVFSERQKVWAGLDANGNWYFDLHGRKVHSLRLDPDSSEAGVLWRVHSITLNTPVAALGYFVPGALQLFLLLTLPGLAAALWLECARAFAVRQKPKGLKE